MLSHYQGQHTHTPSQHRIDTTIEMQNMRELEKSVQDGIEDAPTYLGNWKLCRVRDGLVDELIFRSDWAGAVDVPADSVAHAA